MVRSSFGHRPRLQDLCKEVRNCAFPTLCTCSAVFIPHKSQPASSSLLGARMFVAERRNSHRHGGFGNPAQLSAARNPRTVQKQRSLAPRMRRYRADRQRRSFLRIPSGHAPVTWCDSSLSICHGASCRWAYRVGDFNFESYPSAASETLQRPGFLRNGLPPPPSPLPFSALGFTGASVCSFSPPRLHSFLSCFAHDWTPDPSR